VPSLSYFLIEVRSREKKKEKREEGEKEMRVIQSVEIHVASTSDSSSFR
jgi:hypothetical protein